MLIRPMELKDCNAVQELFAQSFHDPWSLESVREMFSIRGYHNFVAVREDKICGYVGMKAVLDEADIVNVAVLPEERGQHIATKLLNTLLEQAGKEGIHTIYLEVREHNKSAICLYEQAGFLQNGRRKNYYDEPKEDAILMMWEER